MLEQDWFLILWALVCVVVVLGMAYWVTRFIAAGSFLTRGPAARRKGNRIEILSQEIIGRDQRLAMVRTGGRYFLLGVTAGQISLLSELTEEDALCGAPPEGAKAEDAPGFAASFKEALRQRIRGDKA